MTHPSKTLPVLVTNVGRVQKGLNYESLRQNPSGRTSGRRHGPGPGRCLGGYFLGAKTFGTATTLTESLHRRQRHRCGDSTDESGRRVTPVHTGPCRVRLCLVTRGNRREVPGCGVKVIRRPFTPVTCPVPVTVTGPTPVIRHPTYPPTETDRGTEVK